MSKPLVHTPEGVRDIYGEEYLRKLMVEEKLHPFPAFLWLSGYSDTYL